jgi:hypothetical protein
VTRLEVARLRRRIEELEHERDYHSELRQNAEARLAFWRNRQA